MTKFVKVNKAPELLEKGCVVIDAPNFLTEIKRCHGKRPKNGLLTPNYLREVCALIGDKYGDQTFNPMTSVNVSAYKGIPFESEKDVEEVVNKIIEKNCPQFLNSFVDYHLKARPSETKLVYFLGSFSHTAPFTENGIDEIKQKDIDTYLGNKKKKVVGKPAITNQEAGLTK